MMTNVFSIILYLVILPIALGIIFNFIFRRSNSMGELRLATKVLDDYVSGFLIMFFAFELAGLYIIYSTNNLSEFVDSMMNFTGGFLVVTVVIAIVITIILIVMKAVRSEIGDDLKSLKPIKSDIAVIAFIVLYIVVSVLFVLPSPKDETYLSIITMQQNDIIGIYNVIDGKLISDIKGNTKLIEVFYILFSKFLGISDMQCMLNLMIAPLLLVFFGVYKRIERIFFTYNIKLSKYEKWTELLFAGICIVLLFVNGSLNVSVPQNIWNGTTMLSAIIVPLCFIYGYAAICEVANRKLYRASVWLVRFLFMLPIAALMSNTGYQIAAILGGIVVVSIIVLAIVNMARRDVKGK